MRGARQKARQADDEPPYALGAEAVYVLRRTNARDQGHGIELFGQGELDEETRDSRIFVQLPDEVRKLFLGNVGGEAVDPRLYPDFLAVTLLGGDVGDGGGVIAGQDHIEPHGHVPFSKPGYL